VNFNFHKLMILIKSLVKCVVMTRDKQEFGAESAVTFFWQI
jgi:hypothetical protein